MEAEERDRWRPRLVHLFEQMGAPSLEMARACMDAERALEGLSGRARINAVRTYVRAGETLRRWLLLARGLPWPRTCVHFIDYMHARAAEPCGPTVPGQLLRALTWIERAASVGERETERESADKERAHASHTLSGIVGGGMLLCALRAARVPAPPTLSRLRPRVTSLLHTRPPRSPP